MTARDQRGLALSVWTSVSLPAFILMVGLGVDFAGHAAAEQEARAVASQAARAATHELRITPDGATLDVAPPSGRRSASPARPGCPPRPGSRAATAPT